MQKQGTAQSGRCPLCRAPSVLKATRGTPLPLIRVHLIAFQAHISFAPDNLDVALMNFMQDWFPRETKAKAKENSDEVAKEMEQELGLDTVKCNIM